MKSVAFAAHHGRMVSLFIFDRLSPLPRKLHDWFGLSFRLQGYSKSYGQICIEMLSMICLGHGNR